VEEWSFTFANETVKAELDALPADMRAYFERIARLVQVVGLEQVHEPSSSTLRTRFGKCGCTGAAGSPARSI
jgi:hypothetical protein